MILPSPENPPAGVDFVVNVFERTYRKLLQRGYIAAKASQHRYAFRRIVVLVNNVEDRSHVETLIAQLIANDEISEAYFVADRLEDALLSSGLSMAELRKTLHYTDCALVALFLPGSPYLLYSDADVRLAEPCDWISPALELFERDARIAVANPDWTDSTLDAETREDSGDFALGYGFSDQIFLIARKEFAKPIYRFWVPIGWRYPMSHLSPIFEQRVDAYMRLNRRLRAVYRKAQYVHEGEEGAAYRKLTFGSRWRRRTMFAFLRVLEKLPGDNPRYHR